MRKVILISASFVFILGLILPPVFAQDLSTSTASSTATSTVTSTKLSKLEQRNEKIRNFSAQMQQRLNVIVGNLDKMAVRIENHINKLAQESTSTDFSAAKAKLTSAKTKIEELKTDIAGLGQKVEGVIVSKTPKTAFYTVREKLVKAFVVKIKVIHKELLEAVLLAKKEIVKIKSQNATSTQDVSDWKTYRNEKYGFEFRYPQNLKINSKYAETSITISSADSGWVFQINVMPKYGNDLDTVINKFISGYINDSYRKDITINDFVISNGNIGNLSAKNFINKNAGDYGNAGAIAIYKENIIEVFGDSHDKDFNIFLNTFKFIK